MKETCKNCVHAKPTYKGIYCEIKQKTDKQKDTCENWGHKA